MRFLIKARLLVHFLFNLQVFEIILDLLELEFFVGQSVLKFNWFFFTLFIFLALSFNQVFHSKCLFNFYSNLFFLFNQRHFQIINFLFQFFTFLPRCFAHHIFLVLFFQLQNLLLQLVVLIPEMVQIRLQSFCLVLVFFHLIEPLL